MEGKAGDTSVIIRSKLFLFLLITLTCANGLSAQDRIEDNSFLLEEAYNQEKGVVQYINTFKRDRGGTWNYSFTNEIPLKGQKHQFSYTIPLNNAGNGTGVGDIAINYRYQAVINEKFAVSPRASLLLPTGSKERFLGTGGVGFQFALPVSVTIAPKLVTHFNAGTTLTPRATNFLRQTAATKDVYVGQSLILLATPTFNVMFESLHENKESLIGQGRTARGGQTTLSPGIRWAHNLKSGWQIVPGFAVPFGVGNTWGSRSTFIYLSFEK